MKINCCGLRQALLLVLACLVFVSNTTPARAMESDNGAATPAAAGDEFWDGRFGFPGIEGAVYAVAVAANGDLYVGGDFTKAGGVDASHIARFDGERWHPLGAGVDRRVRAIAIHGETVYVGGDFDVAGHLDASRIARWNGVEWATVGDGTGPIDDDYGSPQPGRVYALLYVDGRLYMGGDFVSVDETPANNVAMWDGKQWRALGGGVGKLDWEGNFIAEGEVLALTAYGDALYVGGEFTQTGNGPANSVAAWNGERWVALGGGLTVHNQDSGDFAKVAALAFFNGNLHVGGTFNRADGKAVSHLALWDGEAWTGVGGGARAGQYTFNMVVSSLAVNGGQLYIGGSFAAVGGKPIDLLARWDGTAFAEVGEGIDDTDYDEVFALAPYGDSGVYIGGKYKFGGDQRMDNIGLWDGETWQVLGRGLLRQAYGDSPARPYALAVDEEGRVYAGGEFQYAGGVSVQNLALWENGRWRNIGAASATIRALVVDGDDLYVGGDFTQIGGIVANHVARWNRTTGQWSALGSGVNDNVYALALGNGLLYVGGNFKAAGNVIAEDVALWDGAQWRPFGTRARIYERGKEGGEVGTYVNALAVAGPVVYIGGHFQTIQYGTNTADLSSFSVMHNITAWNQLTDEWYWVGAPLHPGVTKSGYSGYSIDVHALAIIGDSLYVGGSFDQAGAIAANNVARYSLATGEWSAPGGGVGGLDGAAVFGVAGYGTDLFAVGKFTAAGAAPARFVARLDTRTDQWSALGSGVSWYNDQFIEVYSVAAASSGVYVGGDFDAAGGRSASGFAHWGGPMQGGNVPANQGGQVDGPDGLTITFPAGAAANDLIVALAGLGGPRQPLPTDLRGVRHFSGSASTVRGSVVTQFLKPYTLRIPYTAAQLAAAGVTDAKTLNLAYWDGAVWQPMLPCAGCGVDEANRVVTVVADHFTEFALVGRVDSDPGANAARLFLPLVRR